MNVFLNGTGPQSALNGGYACSLSHIGSHAI